MSSRLAAPPILSTPDNDQLLQKTSALETRPALSENALEATYEIRRTATEIRQGGWTNIALQFPDCMLVDAPGVAQFLSEKLKFGDGFDPKARKIHILADTSYSACCVDEVAAEHVSADVVVHYGRACLSPTSRLPVIYVYTCPELDHQSVIREFASVFSKKDASVVLMADLTFQHHIHDLTENLHALGYFNVMATEVIRDPDAIIPNRKIAGHVSDPASLREFSLFHISDPPSSLLLALHSCFATLHVFSTSPSSTHCLDNVTTRAAALLRRRYARVLSLASAGVIGILVNTLSVSNYLASIDIIRRKISGAGKKSYTFVVGKLNPAKLANFAEVEGWVAVGCWESGLIEDDAGYWRPVVTPFELGAALTSDEERVWDGTWWGGIEKLTLIERPVGNGALYMTRRDEHAGKMLIAEDNGVDGKGEDETEKGSGGQEGEVQGKEEKENSEENSEEVEVNDESEEESSPPTFDLRTGKLIGRSQPMKLAKSRSARRQDGRQANMALEASRASADLAMVNGVFSPGAQFLRLERTWQGLGSDFHEDDRGSSTVVEEGLGGVARQYKRSGGEGEGSKPSV